MDREQLTAWIEQGLSLEQIAAMVDRDPSTVGYWCRKHGLKPNGREKHAARGGLTREQLEPLVEQELTLEQIAAAVGRSVSTVRHWLKRYGLRTKGRRGRRPRVPFEQRQAVIAAGERTVTGSCSVHGQQVFVIEGTGRARCRRCRIERVSEHRRRTKAKLVAEAGGRCRLCGYDRYLGALEFHHNDPSKKAFALSLQGITRSLRALREEAKKCTLLCANCHAEVEGGFSTLG